MSAIEMPAETARLHRVPSTDDALRGDKGPGDASKMPLLLTHLAMSCSRAGREMMMAIWRETWVSGMLMAGGTRSAPGQSAS